jgi:hypothetical protein
MRKLAILLIACFFLAGTAYAETFKITNINGKPVDIKTYEKDSGKYVWSCTDQISTFEADGKTLIRLTEDGEGQYGNDKKYKTWHAESIYLYVNETIIPQSSSLEFKDKDGVIVGMLKTTFDTKEGTVKCKMLNDRKQFDYKEGMIDKNALGLALVNYPFERKSDLVFPMLTNEPSYYSMTMVNKGIDVLTVNGATVECYKLQMVPDLGFLGIFAPFVPKTYFWYRVAAPHEFVRYEGLESGLNTPYIVMKVGEQK